MRQAKAKLVQCIEGTKLLHRRLKEKRQSRGNNRERDAKLKSTSSIKSCVRKPQEETYKLVNKERNPKSMVDVPTRSETGASC
mmetsp:Transcript_30156/g.115670  ORF Transcript_30156/g.115670 Transcript_30156/m.115670 type:complete len:83 (+) Transcript_30156:2-250(+)